MPRSRELSGARKGATRPKGRSTGRSKLKVRKADFFRHANMRTVTVADILHVQDIVCVIFDGLSAADILSAVRASTLLYDPGRLNSVSSEAVGVAETCESCKVCKAWVLYNICSR